MDTLPEELCVIIQRCCTSVSQLVLAQTCRFYFRILDRDEWRESVEKEFSSIPRPSLNLKETSCISTIALTYNSLGLVRHFHNSGWEHHHPIGFHLAVSYDCSEVLEYLFRRGMRTEPIMTSVWYNELITGSWFVPDVGCLKYLIEKRNMELGTEAIDNIVGFDLLDSYTYLVENGLVQPADADVDNAAMCGSISILKYLLSKGYDFEDRYLVIEEVLANHGEEMIEYLISECGFKVTHSV